MADYDSLRSTIAALIDRKAEGTHWDFKRCHHSDKYDLIHDVLCLANANHRGDRFLIFGVDNNDYSLHSMGDDTGRRTQADIADLFRGNASKFFQSRFPEFYLREISIADELLDVLVIVDTPHKPHYLVQRIGRLCAHHIYTRVCDTNTPVNDAAQPHDIERMWRERFGLDMSPLRSVHRYLSELQSWMPVAQEPSGLHLYHAVFPEFTLKVTDAEDYIDCHQEWTFGEVRTDNNHAGYYEVRYHQTCLARIHYVSFDDRKKSMVAPKWEARGRGRFYFYEAQSLSYAVQRFHSILEQEDHSTSLSIRGNEEAARLARLRWGHHMKIPIVHAGELDGFLRPFDERETVEPSKDKAEQYDLFLRNQLAFEDWRTNRAI